MPTPLMGISRYLIPLLSTSWLLPAHAAGCEQPLLQLAASGKVIAGSHQALIQHVHDGGRVRIGWQLDWNVDGHIDVAHWADAHFLTIFEGRLYAQIEDMQRQIPLPSSVRYTEAEDQRGARWTGKLASDGVLEGRFANGRSRRWSVASRWCPLTKGALSDTATLAHACVARWHEQYRNSADGVTERGDRLALVAALRRGDPLRVAWGSTYADGDYTMEHVAEPVFFSIVGGDHVVAQLPEHVGQTTYTRLHDARFGAEPQVMWRGLLRTDGLYDAVWVDRGDGEVVRRLPQRAAVSWLTQSLPPDCPTSPTLQLAVPGGVTADSQRASERLPQ